MSKTAVDLRTSGRAIPLIRVYIVRHGETDENRLGIIQGQLDTRLNNTGIQQAQQVARALKDIPFAFAFSSDLERAVKTAEVILKEHAHVRLQQQPILRERHMGELQGASAAQKKDLKSGKLPNSSMEAVDAFAARTLQWWNATIEGLAQAETSPSRDNIHILVVSHGAYIAMLVHSLVASRAVAVGRQAYDGRCYNTSVTILEMLRHRRWKLERYSDISHLLRPAVETNADDLGR